MAFDVKDSGHRKEYEGGMVRDTADKTDFSLIYDGPMLVRWAEHLTKGAKKYEARNWMKGTGQEVLDRARASAARHFAQWMAGETDEDHAAAVYFNVNLAEYVKDKGIEVEPQPAEEPGGITVGVSTGQCGPAGIRPNYHPFGRCICGQEVGLVGNLCTKRCGYFL